MPYIKLTTNVDASKVDTTAAHKTLSKTISDLFGVPEAVVMVITEYGQDLSFGTTSEPAAFFHVRTIGNVNPEKNVTTFAAITKAAETLLGVNAGRVFIIADDIPMKNWGFNGAPVQL